MPLLARIGHPRYAQAFADHLKSLGVDVAVHPTPEGVEIKLQDPSQMDRASQELSLFQSDPDHPRYLQASWLVDESPDQNQAQKLSRLYQSTSLRGALKQTGWVTKSVVLICTFVFIYTSQGADPHTRELFLFFNNFEQLASFEQAWRWLSPALLHFGLIHFAFNMSAWWIFGGMVERAQSSARLVLLALVTAAISNLVQFAWVGDNFGGLSGVVYGVLGYLWFYQRFHPHPPFNLPQGFVVFMLLALALGFTGWLNTANQAHLSGLLCGCLMGYFYGVLDAKKGR